MSKPANPDDSTADPQQINRQPRWDAEWRNEHRRRQKGTHKISDFNLQKRKSRYLAEKRNIDRQEAARKLNRGEIELLRPGGIVIQFGYTTTCMPMEQGYQRQEAVIWNTLGQMNDYLSTVDKKPGELQAEPRWFK